MSVAIPSGTGVRQDSLIYKLNKLKENIFGGRHRLKSPSQKINTTNKNKINSKNN